MHKLAPRDPAVVRRVGVLAGYTAAWLVISAVAGLVFFLSSSRTIELASHDVVVSPDLSGYAVMRTGAILPDVRVPSGSPFGVELQLGKSTASSTNELVTRYAYIASQPEGEIAKVRDTIRDLALAAALRGAVLGLVVVLAWRAVGRRRRRELRDRLRRLHGRQVGLGLLVAGAVGVALWQPWAPDDPGGGQGDWMALRDFVGADLSLPADLDRVEVRGDVTTAETRRLAASAVDAYDRSTSFYDQVVQDAGDLTLRQPAPGDTVVLLVSDRHDNIGMDPVARAIADAAGATAVFDAGDDTSTGSRWEAFSLDSATAAFDDLDRWGVAGNHDHGDFVHRYLADHGWTMLDGEVVDGPGGTTILGVDDPRSSGLGSWREETGLSFEEVAERLADAACAHGGVTTVLVHDVDLGRPALERGCVDLLLAGHLHLRAGPERVVGDGGAVGYSYTTGTAGGAAYAIALGKPRRTADISLVTYHDGRPAGIQWVSMRTDGRFHVGPYVPLTSS